MQTYVNRLVTLAEFVALGVALIVSSVLSLPEDLDDGVGDRDER